MIKVIALDLDGTLLTSDKKISPRTVHVLNECKQRGYKIVIATGRMYPSVIKMMPFEFETDTLIHSNGAGIYQGLSKIHEDLISAEAALQIVGFLETAFPELMITVLVGDLCYANRAQEPSNRWIVVPDLKKVIDRPVERIIFKMGKPEYFQVMQQVLPSECRLVITDRIFIEVVSGTASKAAALQKVLTGWNLSFDHVIAFGDDLNDLELLSSSKIGVAMGNAHPEIIQIADAVTLSHDEDGVAYYLEKFIIEASA